MDEYALYSLISALILFQIVWLYFIYRDRKFIYSFFVVEPLCKAARRWLLTHDPKYQMAFISSEVTRRREEVRARGGSADEIDRIHTFGVADELGLNSFKNL